MKSAEEIAAAVISALNPRSETLEQMRPELAKLLRSAADELHAKSDHSDAGGSGPIDPDATPDPTALLAAIERGMISIGDRLVSSGLGERIERWLYLDRTKAGVRWQLADAEPTEPVAIDAIVIAELRSSRPVEGTHLRDVLHLGRVSVRSAWIDAVRQVVLCPVPS